MAAKRSIKDAQHRTAPGAARMRPGGVQREKDQKLDQIGGHLRKLYRDVLAEPIPDELLRVLGEMSEKERKG